MKLKGGGASGCHASESSYHHEDGARMVKSRKMKQKVIFVTEGVVAILIIATVYALVTGINIFRGFLLQTPGRQTLSLLALGVAGFLIVRGTHVLRDGISMIRRGWQMGRERRRR